MQPHLFYSPEYDIHAFGLEKLHPFDTRKYSRAYGELTRNLGEKIGQLTVAVETPAGESLLRLVHSAEYLAQLKERDYLARALEVPMLSSLPLAFIEARVLRPMRLATMGTVLAARHAMGGGIGVNLSGGYHHASGERGEGFCLFADIAIAIASLRSAGQLGADDRVLIVDLDAHQGNGLETVFKCDRRVFFVDIYNRDIYPNDRAARARIDYDVPLPSGTGDKTYLQSLADFLPRAIADVQPKLVFYNAGTDVFHEDLLGGFRLSFDGVRERDRFVFEHLRRASLPWVMVPSGGYSGESYRLIASSVQRLFEV